MAPPTPAVMVMRGVHSPSVVSYGVNKWVVFDVLIFKGLVRESIVTICKFYELDCVWGKGSIDVWFWFGAPSMLRMSRLSFAWQWHGVGGGMCI